MFAGEWSAGGKALAVLLTFASGREESEVNGVERSSWAGVDFAINFTVTTVP